MTNNNTKLLIIFISIFLFGYGEALAQWVPGYTNRIPLTIKGENIGDGVAPENPIEGITFLISLTDDVGFRLAELAHTSFAGKVQHINGFDIIFAEPDGTVLPHGTLVYDRTNGDFKAWVKLGLVEEQDKTFYLYYGNPGVSVDPSTTDIWGEEYLAVLGLDDANAAIGGNPANFNGDLKNIIDASGKGNHGVNNGYLDVNGPHLATINGNGKIGSSLAFNTDEQSDGVLFDPIDVTNDLPRNQMTISAWIWPNGTGAGDDGIEGTGDDPIAAGNDAGSDGRIISKARNGTAIAEHVWMLNVQDGRLRARIMTDDNGVVQLFADNNESNLVPNEWNYVAFVYDGENMKLFERDQMITSVAQNGDISIDPEAFVSIGTQPIKKNNTDQWITNSDDYRFDGMIDEVRVAQAVRPDEWLVTEFNNINNPGGSIETPGGEEICNAEGGSVFPANLTIDPFGEVDLTLQGYSGAGTPTYQWQISYNGVDFTDIPSASLIDYHTDPLSSTTFIRVLTTDDDCTVASEMARIDINAPFPAGCYQYRKKITISNDLFSGNETLTDFPFLVEVTDNDLKGVSGKVLSPEGLDILFTAADGSTPLDFERVSYDRQEGSFSAWVKIPALTNGVLPEIYMYYGNLSETDLSTTATWSAAYKGVWHLDSHLESATDATDRNGLNFGTVNTEGMVGDAQLFNGNDYISVADNTDFRFTATDDYTVSFWMYQDEKPGEEMGIVTKAGESNDYYGFWNEANDKWDFAQDGPTNYNARIQSWHYIIMVQTGGSKKELYVDGQLWTTEGLAADADGLGDLVFGANKKNGVQFENYFSGKLDEIRIQNRAVTAEWVEAEYNNQHTPEASYTLGIEESNEDVKGGTAVADDEFVLEGGQTTIRLSGQSAGAIQWQSSTDNETFTDILGENGTILETGALTVTTYFRALIDISEICNEVVSRLAVVDVGGPFLPCYRFRKKIAIDGDMVVGNEVLTDFPYLFKITDADLAANAGKVHSPFGYDIAFTAADSSALDFQLEKYDPSTGELVAWVKLPAISAANPPSIYMNYGNPTVTTDQSSDNVWSGDYEAVWHFNENLQDGTSNGIDGTNNGTQTQLAGHIGSAQYFDGADDYIDLSANADLSDLLGGTAMVSFWMKTTQAGANNPKSAPGLMGITGSSEDMYYGYLDASSRVGARVGNGKSANSTTVVGDDAWYFVVIQREHVSGDIKVYVDGQLETTENSVSGIKGESFDKIGTIENSGVFFGGNLDELRILNILKSAEWIGTEYNNQADPTSTYSVSKEYINHDVSTLGGVASASDDFIEAGEQVDITLIDSNGDIQWQFSSDGSTFTDISGENATVLQNVPASSVVGTFYYRAKVISEGCEDYSSIEILRVIAPFSDDYAFRKLITVNPSGTCGDTPLPNFPVLVNISADPDLVHFDDEVNDKVYTSDGSDFAFTDGDGETILPYDIEHYNPATGELVAWVRVPLYDPLNPAVFYLYYGSECDTDQPSKATWYDGFETVWHFNQSSDADGLTYEMLDATGFENHANSEGASVLSQVDAKIGKGIGMNLADESGAQYLSVDKQTNFSFTRDFSVSAWVKVAEANGDESIITKTNGADVDNHKFFLGVNSDYELLLKATTETDFVEITSSNTIVADTWYYLTATYDGTTLKGYINGEIAISTPLSGTMIHSGDDQVLIGKTWDNNYFQGEIDEVQFASTARSADWICHAYHNQANGGLSIGFDNEENQYTWKGGAAGNETSWAAPENWSGCRLPRDGGNIIIPEVDDYPVLDMDPTIGDLLIEENALLTLADRVLTIQGDVENEGSIVAGSSQVVFSGAEEQEISSIQVLGFYNFTLANAEGVSLETSISVANILNLSTGHLTTNGYEVLIENTGTSEVSGANADKFIITNGQGTLAQEGLGQGQREGDILFPVGTDTTSYTPLSIDNSTGTADRFDVGICDGVYREGTCETGTQITEKVVLKTWNVAEETPGGSDATITLGWDEGDEAADFSRDGLFMARHASDMVWDNFHTGSFITTSPFSLSVLGFSSFGSFGIGSDLSLLPVRLLSFDAEASENSVSISWETIDEIGGEVYTVQKSRDGKIFEPIAIKDGRNPDGAQAAYKVVDSQPWNGVNYYRLKIEEPDGKVTFSKIVVVNAKSNNLLVVYPNPITTEGLHYDLNVDGPVSIEVINAAGLVLKTMQFEEVPQTDRVIDFNSLKPGLYFVRFHTATNTYVEKVIKK
ncbi:DUF2341 domain-containing protein [Flammeovirgaceae bacterium SG7u.111]|nr:DUF2341 domain-containing protein [Flammeovirgaceae bacterium SG7u.132]WPO37736.1 DUF2341 domain-containing protein [Flammeovirgaceae bacterium SG7u.111]